MVSNTVTEKDVAPKEEGGCEAAATFGGIIGFT